MKKTLSFLKPYKIQVIIAYILTLTELAIELSLPFLFGKMINEGVVTERIDIVLYWGVILLVLTFISFSSGILNSFYSSHTSHSFAYDVRHALLQKIQSFSYPVFNSLSTSKLVTHFTNDIRQVQTAIFMALRIMLRAPLLIVGSVIMTFFINVKLALIFALVIPLVIVFILYILEKTSHFFKDVQARVDQVNLILQETLLNMKLIKSFNRQSHEKDKFKQANKDLTVTTRKAFRFVESSMPILLLMLNVTIVFVLWFGHTEVLYNKTDVGDVVAVINYATRIVMAISLLPFITLHVSRLRASSQRLSDILEITDDEHIHVEENAEHIKGHIEFRNVSFSYDKEGNQALTNINVTINEGETIAIIGATGSGKTTLFQLVSRLFTEDEGQVFIDRKPASDYSVSSLRQAIGYVPQTPLLFSGSIRENIAWGKRDTRTEDIVKATKDAQIYDVITSLPNQFDTEVSQRGVNLSGGQKQRLSIARALVRKPNILLLDDCTSALDYATEDALLQALSHYQSTTMIVTQKISTAMKADCILLLDHGKLINKGTHEELLGQSPLYQAIVQSQTEEEATYAT